MPKFKRILVPVDGSDTSNHALGAAIQLARDCGGRLRILHVLDELAYVGGFEYSGALAAYAREDAKRLLEEAGALATAAGVEYDIQFVDQPGQRLGETVSSAAVAWDADVIVLGTHGRKGVERMLLGSGADQVIRRAPVPVLVVPPAVE